MMDKLKEEIQTMNQEYGQLGAEVMDKSQLVAKEMVKMFSQLEREGVGFDHTLGIEENRRNLTFTKTLRKYDTQLVDQWLERPSQYAKELRDLS